VAAQNGSTVKVSDLLSYTARWGLGILASIIVLGIGMLVTQTVRHSEEMDELKRTLAVTNGAFQGFTALMNQRNAEHDRRLDELDRRIAANAEQIYLLWRAVVR
jgi:hypothetical protein